MTERSKVTGIVLSVHNMGENDKSLTILTKERGKMQVISQRSRKQNHKLFAVSQPLTYAEFEVSYTRNYVYLNSAECKDTFGDLKGDLDSICYSTYFAEVAEKCTVEMQDERNILNLLFVTFHAMRKKQMPYALIKSVFEYKILQFIGVGLEVFSCLSCGKEENLRVLSFVEGGMFCTDCGKMHRGEHIEGNVVYTMQYVAAVPLTKLYSFTLTDKLQAEFCQIVRKFFAMNMDYDFKSVKMLELL